MRFREVALSENGMLGRALVRIGSWHQFPPHGSLLDEVVDFQATQQLCDGVENVNDGKEHNEQVSWCFCGNVLLFCRL